jgi:acetyl esterase/lipase
MPQDILELAPPPADSRISYGPDAQHFFDLRRPVPAKSGAKQASPTVINIHGGYWRARYDLAHAGHLCAALTKAGLATINLEYRRVGNPGGGWPGTFDDLRSALRYLREHAAQLHLDPARFMLMGHSAGGQLALALAAHDHSSEHGLRGAVSLAGVLDLQKAYDLHLSNDAVVEFLGGTPKQVPEHYAEADPMRLSIKIPQWLIHGADDQVVPVEISRGYFAAKKARGEDVQLIEPPHTGHFEVIDPRSTAWADVLKTAMDRLVA